MPDENPNLGLAVRYQDHLPSAVCFNTGSLVGLSTGEVISPENFLCVHTGCPEAAEQHSPHVTKAPVCDPGALGSGLWAANGSRVSFPHP